MRATVQGRGVRSRTVGGTLVGVVVLAVLAPVWLPASPAGASTGVEPKPWYHDDDGDGLVTVTDKPLPTSFIGTGETGMSFVTQSVAAMLGNAYGFDGAVADPSAYVGASPYDDTPTAAPDILASDVSRGITYVGEGDVKRPVPVVRAVRIQQRVDGEVEAVAIGTMRDGFPEELGSWTFGADEVTNEQMRGDPVDVVVVHGRRVLFATTQGVYLYTLDPAAEFEPAPPGWPMPDCDVCLVGGEELGGDHLSAPPAALARMDASGVNLARNADLVGEDDDAEDFRIADGTHVTVATRTASTDGPDRIEQLVRVDAGGPELPQSTQIPTDFVLSTTTSNLPDLPAGAPVRVRMGPILDFTQTDNMKVGVALQFGGQWRLYEAGWDSGTLAPRTAAGGGVHQCSGAPDDLEQPWPDGMQVAFDFRTAQAIDRNGDWRRLLAATCVTAQGGSLIVDSFVVSPGLPGRGELAQDEGRAVRTVTAPDDVLVDPQAHVTFPCFRVRHVLGAPPEPAEGETPREDLCGIEDGAVYTHTGDGGDTATVLRPGYVGAAVLAGLVDAAGGETTRAAAPRTAYVAAQPFADPLAAGGDWHQYWVHQDLTGDGVVRHLDRAPVDTMSLEAKLDPQYAACLVDGPKPDPDAGGEQPQAPEDCDPRIEIGEPLPVAVLAAPPQVAGAGQDASPPVFAQSASVGSSTEELSSVRVGGSVGVMIEDPSGAFGGGLSVSYLQQVDDTISDGSTTTTGEAFHGQVGADTIVYQATTMWTMTGTIVTSSTGLGAGTTTTLRNPRSNVTGSASLDFLESQYPEMYGENAPVGRGLRETLGHDVGDPGSYMSFDPETDEAGAAVDEYCEGNIDGTEPPPVPDVRSDLSENPFETGSPTPPDDAVLVSANHQVLAGTPNQESASVDLVESTERSHLRSHSIDVEASVKLAYATASVTAGGTFGDGWTYSVAESTAFQGAVGHIPSAGLEDETYEWRMFLCKRDVGGEGLRLPVWVLNYTVDGYEGSGGMSLSPPEPVSPLPSDEVSPGDPVLRWTQPQGVIRTFDVELEAIGADDVRTATLSYDSVEEYRTRVEEEGRDFAFAPNPLLPDQLYSWRVVATDFLGNTVDTGNVLFSTASLPDASFTTDPAVPIAGEPYRLVAALQGEGVTHEWRLGADADWLPNQPAQLGLYAPDEPGTLVVGHRVTTPDGTATHTDEVVFRPEPDDVYTVDEDGRLAVDADGGVLANDGTADTATLLDTTLRGALRLNRDGAFTYVPDPDLCGPDAFVYASSEQGQDPVEATVVIEVACANDRPVAADDPDWTGTEDEVLEVPAPGVLGNDVDVDDPEDAVDDGELSTVMVGDPQRGTVDLADHGGFVYTPHPDACGQDAFTYRASDGVGESDLATVTVDVACAPEPDPDETPGQDPDGGGGDGDGVDDPDGGPGVGPDLPPSALRVLGGQRAVEDVVVEHLRDEVDHQVARIAGPDRYATAARVARQGWPDGASTVYVATGEQFPDGVAAAAAAVREDAPMLLTARAALPAPTQRALEDLQPDRVVVIGGEHAVEADVLRSIHDVTGVDPQRIAGGDRYETAARVAETVWSGTEVVYLATGETFPDALTGAAAAAREDAPVLLARPDGLPPVVADALRRLQPDRAVLLGGRRALGASVREAVASLVGTNPSRIAGPDRYATSAAVARAGWPDGTETAFLATGAAFADALSGSAAAGRADVPVLLTAAAYLPDSTRSSLHEVLTSP